MKKEKTFRAPDGSLHCIDEEFTYLLPSGCVEIDVKEIGVSNAVNPKRWDILSALAAIDTESVRPSRAVALAIAAGQVPAAADVAKLAELEQRAQDLRNELRTLP